MPSPAGNRTTLITGGGGHLGRHVVRKFLDGGDQVHVAVFDGEEGRALATFLGTDPGGTLHPHVAGDLSEPGAVETLTAAVRERAGRLPQILLNLAGGFAMHPIEETGPDTWERMWRMNATTAFLCSRALLPAMKEEGWGRIVNVSALPALDRGQAGLTAYGAAKAAVLNLTHTLAREGTEHGVTVNAVLPSIIDTPANREAMPDADRSHWVPPDEIAEVVWFLASDQARVVSGAAIPLSLA